MVNEQGGTAGNIGLFERSWFRWLGWAIMLVAAVIPFFASFLYDVIVHGTLPERWHWDEGLFFTLPLLVITVVAWYSPLLGGTLAAIAGLLGLLIGLGFAGLNDTFIFIVYGPFFIGGIMCNVYGWQERNRKQEADSPAE